MKLELKNLAAYLPYKIKVILRGKNSGYFISGLGSNYIDLNHDKKKLSYKIVLYDEIKPILRAMSDISNIIEHNGEKFKPFNILTKRASEYIPEKNLKKKAISELLGNYSQVEKLIEWNFDIYGLIDAGLAVDVNSL